MRKLAIFLSLFVLRTFEIEAGEIKTVETFPELQNEVIKRNPTLDGDGDSNSNSTLARFNSGDFGPAVITTTTDVTNKYQIFNCEGSDIQSLILIPCGSVSSCNQRISCLDHPARCDRMEVLTAGQIITGGKCSDSLLSSHDNSSDSCFSVSYQNFWYSDFGAVVECTSSHFQKTLFYSFTEKHWKMFYTLDSPWLLLNLTAMKPRNPNGLEGEDSFFTLKNESTISVWEDVEIGVSCDLVPFFFNMDTFVVYLTRSDGRTTKLVKSGINGERREPSWTSSGMRTRRFRVPLDVTSVSCSTSLDLEDRRVITKTLNISVLVPPKNLTVPSLKSSNGSERLLIGQKLGCNFTGSPLNISNYREMLKILTGFLRVNVIQSAVHFFALLNRVGDNFGCAPLPSSNYSNKSAPSVIKRPFHFLLNFVLSPPWINKTVEGQSGNFRMDSVVTCAAGLLAGVLNVDVSAEDFPLLMCRFSGDPIPHVTWMKNGRELYLTSGESEKKKTNSSQLTEISYFNLRQEIVDRKTKFEANFTCIVQNYLGSDALEFRVVSMPKKTIQVHEEIPKLTSLLLSINRTLDKIDKRQGNSKEKSDSPQGIFIILLVVIFFMNLTIFLSYCINNWNWIWNCQNPRAQHFTAIFTRQKRRLWNKFGNSLSTAQLELQTQNYESPMNFK